MIDLILYAPTKELLIDFLREKGLQTRSETPVLDPETGEEIGTDYGDWKDAPGVSRCWWAGSGKLMIAQAEVDAEGNITTPAEYLPGFAMILRLRGEAYAADRNDVTPGEAPLKQWERSTLAGSMRAQGTQGIFQNMNNLKYFEVNQVRYFDPDEVEQFLADNGLSGHQWLGGNSY